MKDGKLYFVSGIDTDAGKTYATGYIARQWVDQGFKVITQKFIQTGCTDPDAVSEDIILHRRIMGTGLLPEDLDHTTCPLRFAYPASPELSARMEGRTVELSQVAKVAGQLASKYDRVLIEGAGGLMVPVKKDHTVIDYIRDMRLPLILVTNPKLGSVNHTLLSIEACISRGIILEAVAYNCCPETSPEITADTREFLKTYIGQNLPDCQFIDIPYISV